MEGLKNGDYVISRTSHKYVKAGKRYKVRKVNSSPWSKFTFYTILENEPDEVDTTNSFCLFNGCGFLDGGNWEICNSPLKAFFIRLFNKINKL